MAQLPVFFFLVEMAQLLQCHMLVYNSLITLLSFILLNRIFNSATYAKKCNQ